jgi:solute carrier family 25 protein 14/30
MSKAMVSSPYADTFRSVGLAGGTALIVVNATHPIDMIKTRFQVNPDFSIPQLIKKEGMGSLYKGIQAAWLREASYTSVKLGGYGPIKSALGADGKDASFFMKFLAGTLAGASGSVLGNPFDVMKTLMMTNTGKTPTPLGTLMSTMYKEQGVRGFYRGMEANILRASVLNGTKMACYDQIKGYVVDYTGWQRKDLRCAFLSAVGAGFCMSVTVTPFDMLRTQMMNQPTDRKLYTGIVDCAMKTVKAGGPQALYRGFFVIWSRFAPQATLQLMVFEQMRSLAGMESL